MRVLILLTVIATAFAACPANQHFEECGSACPLTCDNYENPPNGCVLMCVTGCFCDEGYVKNQAGHCVKAEACATSNAEVCGENEKFNGCGTACPLTCDNFNNPPKGCTLQCVPGCHCQKGYVRNDNGQCVLPENCPAEELCDVNQKFNPCGTACPLTCDNYDNPPKACTKQCVSGCHCAKGYVRNAEGNCVKPGQCPKKAVCGKNERFTECGTACPLTCNNHNNPPRICTMQCVIGCQCEEGYVRDSSGDCVRPENCQAQAPLTLCTLHPDSGDCRAFVPRFYYDKYSKKCSEFVYGGCGGNENNFKNKEDCENSCLEKAVGHLDRPDCDKGPDAGRCKAFNIRFYYDQKEGMCKQFVYGGCEGNRNNFETEFDCQNKCGALMTPKNELCSLQKVVGPCKAAFPRFYYNSESGKCEKFLYGGCRGNSNNFLSEEYCTAACV